MKIRLTIFLKTGWRIQKTESLLPDTTTKTNGKLAMTKMEIPPFLLISRKLQNLWLTLATVKKFSLDPELTTWDQPLSKLVLHKATCKKVKVKCGNPTMHKRGKDPEKEIFQPTQSTTEGWDTNIKISWWVRNKIGVKDHQLDQDLHKDIMLWLAHHLKCYHHQTMSVMPQPSVTTSSTESRENRESTSNTRRSSRSIKSNTRSLRYLRELERR